jgi:hypothetical protein
VAVPVLGSVPIPFLVLVLVVAAGYVIARLLGAHAGVVGRRWARRLARDIREGVRREIDDVGFGGLDAIDRSRRELARAVRAVERCR